MKKIFFRSILIAVFSLVGISISSATANAAITSPSSMSYSAFNLNDLADAPLLKFAETWARNWNFEGHNVPTDFNSDYGNWNYSETTYEPWLFDRASVGYFLYKRSTTATEKNRWYQQFLSDFAYYRTHIDANGFFTPKKGEQDTKYGYVTPFLLYERETSDSQYRPIAEIIYNSWLKEFSNTYNSQSNGLWTEREIALALEAAVSWYELSGSAQALTRANALVSQWSVVANTGNGAPLVTIDRHEGGGTNGSQLITSPWMSALYFQAARRLNVLTGNTEVLQQVINYADWMERYGYFNGIILHPELAGIIMPYYLVGPTGPSTPDTPNWDDFNHCLDVSNLVGFAIQAKQSLGQSTSALVTRQAQLKACAVFSFNDATRTTINLPKYRINPPRKFNWWMRSTVGADLALVNTPSADVNGVCGEANNAALRGSPINNLCSSGTASAVSGYGPWTWTCAGSNGGTVGCSAQVSQTTPYIPMPVPSLGKFIVGQQVKTTVNLNVRAASSISGKLLGTQKMGSIGVVVSGPVKASGYSWWKINYSTGADGYSVENYLR